jgi:hypothetical protein
MAAYSFDEYLKSIERLDYKEMIEDVRGETQALQVPSSSRPGSIPAGLSQTRQYLEDLNGLLILLQYGRKYPKMTEASFKKMRPLCERLVRLGQMKEEALQIFQQSEA